jgi:hypothetical protein
LSVRIEQITHGPNHHFYGYIGHVQNIPWSKSGRHIVALRTTFQDHLPEPDEAADIILIDTQDNYRITVIDQTRAWNLQQGTMLYWNPSAPNTQLFFNDRDPKSNKVFCVLFDISKGSSGQRIREYTFADTPIGNSGVAQNGGHFLGINYGRLARLRPVTGYPAAYDWTVGVDHPADDGIFKVNIETGGKELLVSYEDLSNALKSVGRVVTGKALFINHTLWNRDGDRIYFYVRADFKTKGRIDIPMTINADGSGLAIHKTHIGGHPEWEFGHRLIGSLNGKQVLYDTDTHEIAGTLGNRTIFPKPGADIALSPNGKWFVNGYSEKGATAYSILNRETGAWIHTRSFNQYGYTKGALRNDPAPCWNRESNKILFPSLTDDQNHTRQLFIVHISPGKPL